MKERIISRLEMDWQAKEKLMDMYGREFNKCLFGREGEETEELL